MASAMDRTQMMLQLARELAPPRPKLARRPGWRFGVELDRADAAVGERLDVWESFLRDGVGEPVVVPWYDDLSLSLTMGNDTSLCAYVCGAYEPNDFFYFDKFVPAGGTVIDLGAHEGLYTVFSSRRVGPTGCVVAVEPSEREIKKLKNNIALNGCTNVHIFETAVGSSNGRARLRIAEDRHAGTNTLGQFIYDVREVASEEVSIRTVDDIVAELGLQRVDVIKADIEGGELAMLLGARETLLRFRPALFLEISPDALRAQGGTPDDVTEFLRTLNYRASVLDNASAALRPFAVVPDSPTMVAEYVPYPVSLAHRDLENEPRIRDERTVFDNQLASGINKARLDHLAWMELPLDGRSVLDVGGGPGHLATSFVQRGCRVLVTDARPENVALARQLYGHEARVMDAESPDFHTLGTFDVVFCYGLLYHVENPLLVLRNLASVAADLVVLETIVCDSHLPVVALVDESLSANQAMRGLACRPSPAWIAMAFDRLGLKVYAPVQPPQHPDFLFEWRDDMAYERNGFNLRCIFVASRKELRNNKLIPLLRS